MKPENKKISAKLRDKCCPQATRGQHGQSWACIIFCSMTMTTRQYVRATATCKTATTILWHNGVTIHRL